PGRICEGRGAGGAQARGGAGGAGAGGGGGGGGGPPPVLSDRGLDAALSGLAALSPVPVTVSVDLPSRPPAAVEAIAYFVVAEGLTNIAKHSHASHAQVVVVRSGD